MFGDVRSALLTLEGAIAIGYELAERVDWPGQFPSPRCCDASKQPHY